MGGIEVTSPTRTSIKRPSEYMYSPRKRLQNEKPLIIERYQVSESLPFNTNSGKLYSLQEEIKQKQDEVNQYRKQILSKKTELYDEELRIRKLEDSIRENSKALREMEESIQQLGDAEKESIRQLESNFELRKRQLDGNHALQLSKLGETLSNEIDQMLKASGESDREKRRELNDSIKQLEESIKNTQKDMTRRLIHLKEVHEIALHEYEHNEKLKTQAAIDEQARLRDSVTSCEMQIKQTQEAIAGGLQKERERLEEELRGLEKSLTTQEEERRRVSADIEASIQEIARLEKSTADYTANYEIYKEEAEALSEMFPALEQKRRLLHAKLHDLKGNIRVFCRIRPDNCGPNSRIELSASDEFNDNGKQDLVISSSDSTASLNGTGRLENNAFQFDKIFDSTSTNMDIFKEWCQLVQCAIDGSRVCVFAYGQTGSGKTHTMSSAQDGMIPLSLRKVFADVEELASHGWEHKVRANFLEIYNETIIDLFGPYNQSLKHEIKHDDITGTTMVTNLQSKILHNSKEAIELLHRANSRRATASTDANERSSRSHSVLTINIEARNKVSGESRSGILNLIDLAGSERIKSSHATGARLKETQAINKSLSSLGDVIYSLSRKMQGGSTNHIPYRNSKLTYLLKNSLQGDSKTLMFVNISPLLRNMSETINSLRFATKVNRTKVQ